MKKLLFLGAMAAMLLGTASCSNDMEPEMTGDGNVQFTIELPGNIDSRAISDGENATKLQIAVYKEDGTLLQDISLLGDKAVTMSGKKATVNFKLVKGLKYSFAFWAQNPNEDAYTFDAATGKVTVDYAKAVANADDGDAFSNREMNLEITGPITKDITLTRPFAQLNYGDVVADYNAAVAAGIDFKQTAVTVKQVANEYDILNQTTTGEVADITWAAANSAMEDKLVVNEETYKWLSMCYFLVPNDESTVTTELSMLNTAGTEFNKITVDNVPVKKNHRTNILGNLFTDDVNFNIIIDERFDQPDYNVDINGRPYLATGAIQVGVNGEQYNTLADAIAAANGETVYLGAGTYNEAIVATDGQTVSIASAGGLTAADVIILQQAKAENGATLNLNGVTVKNSATADNATSAAIYINSSTATIQNVVAEGQRGVNVKGGSTVVISNSELNAVGGYSRGVQISDDNNNVTVEGSTVNAKYYAINVGQPSANNTVKITNSEISGWSITNIWGTSSSYEFENCKFTSYNFTTNPNTNAFAAFVTNPDADNNTFSFTDCSLYLSSANTSPQYLMLLGGHNNVYNGNNLSIKGENTNTNGYLLGLKQDGATYTFNFENVGGTWDGEDFTFE